MSETKTPMWLNAVVLIGGTLAILSLLGTSYYFACLDEERGKFVYIDHVFRDYEKDMIKANKKYKGRILRIEGTIADVLKDESGHLFLMVYGDNLFKAVICNFHPKHSEQLSKLAPGCFVKLKGKCVGFTVGVKLVECQFVE